MDFVKSILVADELFSVFQAVLLVIAPILGCFPPFLISFDIDDKDCIYTRGLGEMYASAHN